MAAKKFYVVWVGLKPGIYSSWTDCKAMVEGYPAAKYKGFNTLAEAEAALGSGAPQYKAKPKVDNITQLKLDVKPNNQHQPIRESLAVDAACSGNPGVMEYRGVHVATGAVWFHKKFELGTNNIGEFLALVHGLAELKKMGSGIPIYTDSMTAISWLRQKKCKTKLEQSPQSQQLFEVVKRAEAWLMGNSFSTQILKWDTENWGEIPADFGRK